jgi:deoxyribonuclease-4
MVSALDEGERLGLDTVQFFTKNQQQWQAKPLDSAMVRDWRARLKQLSWADRTVSHASYLINLAAPADELWNKSIALMQIEIERCEELGIPFLVHHPGAYTTSSLDDGLKRIALAYKQLFATTRGYKTISCLEGTAGAGSTIGGDFDHLARLRALIIEATGEPSRIGFCLDSCHLHAAGYDMSTLASATRVLDDFDARCGVANLKVWHLNDSKGKLGSHLDRHAHVGEGEVGRGVDAATLADSGFAAIVNHPAFAGVPKILETPKEEPAKGDRPAVAWDQINVARLRSLMRGTAEPNLPGLRSPLATPTPAKPKVKNGSKANKSPTSATATRLESAERQQSRPAKKAGSKAPDAPKAKKGSPQTAVHKGQAPAASKAKSPGKTRQPGKTGLKAGTRRKSR